MKPKSKQVQVMEDEEWMTLERPPVSHAARSHARRNKMMKLDDLLLENDKEKREQEKKKLIAKEEEEEEEESSDEEGDAGADQLAELINKCSAQVGNDVDMKDAPKWGEKIFGPQRDMQPFAFSSDEMASVKRITAVATSLEFTLDPENGEDALLEQLLLGGWGSILLFRAGVHQPGFLRWIFMAYSRDVKMQRAAVDVLCEYFMEKTEPVWKPTLKDILDALHSYGYLDQPVENSSENVRPSDVPMNFGSLLRLLLTVCKARILSPPDEEKLLLALARCLLDRELLQYFILIQDCIAELLNNLSTSSIMKIAPSLARISKELVNVYHVIISLRGKQEQVVPLQKESAFQVMSSISQGKLTRCPTDVIAGLDEYDPKSNNIDFVQLYYHLNLVDMWLKGDTNFTSDEDAVSYWKRVLRTFSVRISCGDYRTCANEVRNRAAFLMSMYSI